MTGLRWRVIVTAAGILASSCTAGQEPSPCHQDLEIAVTVDADVRVSWSPACGMAELAITEWPGTGEPGAVRWWVQRLDHRNTIESGVEYGHAPPGTATVVQARSLEEGKSYLVSLFYYMPINGGQFIMGSAQGNFTR